MFADDLAFINIDDWLDEELAALLQIEQREGDGLACAHGDHGAACTVFDFACVGVVAVEDVVHDAEAARIGHEFSTISQKSSGRNEIGQTGHAVGGVHRLDAAAPLAKLLHDGAHVFLRDVDGQFFDGFLCDAIHFLQNDLRTRHLEFIAFAAHLLNENGEVEFATSGDLETHSFFIRNDLQCDIRHRLAGEPLRQMA